MRLNWFRVESAGRNFAKSLIVLVCALGAAACVRAGRQTGANTVPSPALEDLANDLASEYGQQQMDRLAEKGDRDSLIAATLIGSANGPKSDVAKGHADVMARLVRDYPADTLAIYAAALVCHVQSQPCPHPEYRGDLLRLDPDNAIHFLLAPNAGKIESRALHSAATAQFADTHFSALLGIVRSALANQPASSFQAHQPVDAIDRDELGLLLRRNEILYVPWPNYGALFAICNPTLAARNEHAAARDDCAKLGLKLLSDRGNNIVTKMVGSSVVRRFARGTAPASDALALRRQYVWLNEQDEAEPTSAEQERLQEEEVRFGEWEAFKRKAARAGVPLIPPEDWIPKNPKGLLLPEHQADPPPGD